MKRKLSTLVAMAALLAAAPALAEWKPSRPLEFIASGAGGGTDNFARTIQAALTRNGIVEESIVVLNKGGGSGAEGFLYARQNRGDPHKVIFGTNNVYLLPHVAKMPYAAEDLMPIYALALDESLIWVKADSPYKTVKDLIEAAKAAPGTVIFGGSQGMVGDVIVTASANYRVGQNFALVTEHWFLPTFTGPVTGLSMFNSIGGRIFGEQWAADLGFIRVAPLGFQAAGFIPIPWVDFTYNFG